MLQGDVSGKPSVISHQLTTLCAPVFSCDVSLSSHSLKPFMVSSLLICYIIAPFFISASFDLYIYHIFQSIILVIFTTTETITSAAPAIPAVYLFLPESPDSYLQTAAPMIQVPIKILLAFFWSHSRHPSCFHEKKAAPHSCVCSLSLFQTLYVFSSL